MYLHPWNLYETISNEVKDAINFYENIAVVLNLNTNLFCIPSKYFQTEINMFVKNTVDLS